MAVSLSITQPSGVVTTYNRITDIRYQPKGSIDIMLSSYLSKAIRDAGGESILDQYISLDISLIDPAQPLISQCYSQLMALGHILNGGTPD